MRQLFLFLVLLLPGAARADDFEPEWRDGCPAGNMSVKQDIDHSRPEASSDPDETYRGTEPNLIGAVPQFDSALVHDQLGLETSSARFASTGMTRDAPWIVPTTLHAAISGTFAHWYRAKWNVGGVGMWSELHMLDGADTIDRMGSVVAAPFVRVGWVATGTTDGTPNDPTRTAGLRNSIALQPIVGFQVGGDDARDDLQRIWARTAFDGVLSSPSDSLGIALEIRTEGVGCYAPFIHLRLALNGTHARVDPSAPTDEHLAIVAPQTVAIGASISAHVAAYVQYGLLVYIGRHDGMVTLPSPLEASVIHRFRVGTELVEPFTDWHFTVGVHADAYRGSVLYDGTVFGLSVDGNLGGRP